MELVAFPSEGAEKDDYVHHPNPMHSPTLSQMELAAPSLTSHGSSRMASSSDRLQVGSQVLATAAGPVSSEVPPVPPNSRRSWCRRHCYCRQSSKAISVFLLVFYIVVSVFYLALHCTKMLDVLADFACVRDWIGVNPAVEVTAGILLGIILVSSLHVLLKVRRPGSLGGERP